MLHSHVQTPSTKSIRINPLMMFFPMLFTGVELRIKQHRGVRDVEVHNLAWNGVYLLREPAFIVPNMEKIEMMARLSSS